MSDGFVLTLNPDDLSLGDLEDFEEMTGTSIEDVVKPVPVMVDGKRVFDEKGRPEMTVKIPAKALVALVFLSQRAKDPSFTREDARRIKVSQLNLTETSPATEKKAEAA